MILILIDSNTVGKNSVKIHLVTLRVLTTDLIGFVPGSDCLESV